MGRIKIYYPNELDEIISFWECDGNRTHDHQCHKLTLYQLSYTLHVVALEGFIPSQTESKPVVLPLYYRAICCRSGSTRTSEVKRRLIYSQLSLPLENTPIIWWSLVDSNHVLRIFSPVHTPCLPKLQVCDS